MARRIRNEVLEMMYRCTSYYEGGYRGIAGSFDGQGLSVGFLQFNFGQGTLQPLLYRVFNEYPYLAEKYFPDGGKWLKFALDNDLIDQWASQIQDSNGNVFDPWYSALYNLCGTDEFVQIQKDAAQEYVNGAIRMSSEFGIDTDRALCLFFDIAVQKGPYYQGYALAEPTYQEKLEAIANYAADTSNPRWRTDVRVRKLSIARGYDVSSEFGLPYPKGWCGIGFSDTSAFEDDTPVVVEEVPEATKAIYALVGCGVIRSPEVWIPNVYDGGTVDGENMYYLIQKFVAMYVVTTTPEHVYTFEEVVNELVAWGISHDSSYWVDNCQPGKTVEGKYAEAIIIGMGKKLRGEI